MFAVRVLAIWFLRWMAQAPANSLSKDKTRVYDETAGVTGGCADQGKTIHLSVCFQTKSG